MFGDDDFEELVDELLELHTFSELLELNDMTEAEALTYLIRGGHIGEPERVFTRYESESLNETEEEFYSQSIED